ncbi:MAG: DedA family protein [bacterium]
MGEITSLLLGYLQNLNYTSIIALMTVESSFIPLPSEIVMPPAGYLAAQGQLNIILVIICGIVGSLLGALINYGIAFYLGRKIIYALVSTRWAKFFLLSPKKIAKAEQYFLRYGQTATFLGRLVVGIRHLISIPAGLSRMPLPSFLLFTGLGSAIWVTILTLFGYWLGKNNELLAVDFEMLSFLGVLCFIAFIIYLIIIHHYQHAEKK